MNTDMQFDPESDRCEPAHDRGKCRTTRRPEWVQVRRAKVVMLAGLSRETHANVFGPDEDDDQAEDLRDHGCGGEHGVDIGFGRRATTSPVAARVMVEPRKAPACQWSLQLRADIDTRSDVVHAGAAQAAGGVVGINGFDREDAEERAAAALDDLELHALHHPVVAADGDERGRHAAERANSRTTPLIGGAPARRPPSLRAIFGCRPASVMMPACFSTVPLFPEAARR